MLGGGIAGLSAERLRSMPSDAASALLHGIASGTSAVFFGALFVAVLVPVLALFIRNVPLRGRAEAPAPAEAELVSAVD